MNEREYVSQDAYSLFHFNTILLSVYQLNGSSIIYTNFLLLNGFRHTE